MADDVSILADTWIKFLKLTTFYKIIQGPV